MAETLVKLPERLVENNLTVAEAWDTCLMCKLLFHALTLVAAIQIDVEHGTIVAQKDLKVVLQAGMRLHHGCDQNKALLYPLAKLGLIRCVCGEAFDGLSLEGHAFQQHALGI